MSSAAAATSAALAERASSVVAIAGMVCGLILLHYSLMSLAIILLHEVFSFPYLLLIKLDLTQCLVAAYNKLNVFCCRHN